MRRTHLDAGALADNVVFRARRQDATVEAPVRRVEVGARRRRDALRAEGGADA